jgi:hypothetical protein
MRRQLSMSSACVRESHAGTAARLAVAAALGNMCWLVHAWAGAFGVGLQLTRRSQVYNDS